MGYSKIVMMNSILVEQVQAKMQMPTVWSDAMSYSRRFYEVGCRNKNIPMVTLYQAIERPHSDGLHDSGCMQWDPQHTIAVQITAFPNHLAVSEVYLLVGKNEDDFVRIVFLPGRSERERVPEIKHLRVTMKQILAKMEEAAKAVEPRIDRLFQEEDAWACGEVQIIEVDSEEVAMSANQDGSGKTETEQNDMWAMKVQEHCVRLG